MFRCPVEVQVKLKVSIDNAVFVELISCLRHLTELRFVRQGREKGVGDDNSPDRQISP